MLNNYNSSFFKFCVVQLMFFLSYNECVNKEEREMNTDKIYAEAIVNEYSIKDTSKVVALKNLIERLSYHH